MEIVQSTGERRWARGHIVPIEIIRWSPGYWGDQGAATYTLDLYVLSERVGSTADVGTLETGADSGGGDCSYGGCIER